MQEDFIHIDHWHRIIFYGKQIGIVKNGVATIDDGCLLIEVSRFLMDNKLSIRYEAGLAVKLAKEDEIQNAHRVKKARVYQLHSDVDPLMRFCGYAELCARHGGLQPELYRQAFDGDVGSDNPEQVFEVLKTKIPSEFGGHSITRSDVMELYNPISRRFFYVDTFALVPVEFDAGKVVVT